MTSSPISIGPTEPLSRAMELMSEKRIRHLPVVEGGMLVGMLSDRDAQRAAPSPFERIDPEPRLAALTVDQVMVRAPWTIGPRYSVHDAVSVLVTKKYGALPVVEDGKLVGIVTPIDLLKGWKTP